MSAPATPVGSPAEDSATGAGFDANGLQVLDRHECLRLLRSVPVGRIVFTERALPAIRLVNFIIDGTWIVIRSVPGSKLAAAESRVVVAFEADEIDTERHAGWSVTVIGQAERVTDPAELARLDELPLRPWAHGVHDNLIRVSTELVSGRRLIDSPAARRATG